MFRGRTWGIVVATTVLGCQVTAEPTASPARTTQSEDALAHAKREHLRTAEMTRVEVVGNKLFLLGTLNARTGERVRDVLRANPSIETIVFTAHGGSVDDEANLALGRFIREQGLDTHLIGNGVIASGGVDLFLAGVERTIEPGGKIGVHSWEHCWSNDETGEHGCKEARDHPRDDPQHQMLGRYIEEMLGSWDFYWFGMHAAGAREMHWMSEQEIVGHRLATKPWTEPAVAQPFDEALETERADILGE